MIVIEKNYKLTSEWIRSYKIEFESHDTVIYFRYKLKEHVRIYKRFGVNRHHGIYYFDKRYNGMEFYRL